MKHIIVRGIVQGVGFRAFVEREAARHGVAGWVRNRSDGSVEAVFVGGADVVDAMIAACKVGPRHGKVDSVEQRAAKPEEAALNPQAGTFSCLPTA